MNFQENSALQGSRGMTVFVLLLFLFLGLWVVFKYFFSGKDTYSIRGLSFILFFNLSCHEFIGNGVRQLRFLSIGSQKSEHLGVGQADASAEPRHFSLCLPSFSHHFP